MTPPGIGYRRTRDAERYIMEDVIPLDHAMGKLAHASYPSPLSDGHCALYGVVAHVFLLSPQYAMITLPL
jgi:hypothetical protein